MIKKNILVIANIVLPLSFGALFYYFLVPDAYFVRILDRLFGRSSTVSITIPENILFSFARYYFLDMIWAYALVMALYFIFGNNAANLVKIFLLAFSFSLAMELLQLTSFVKGTFDLIDIGAEFLAEIFAVFIIIKLERKKLE